MNLNIFLSPQVFMKRARSMILASCAINAPDLEELENKAAAELDRADGPILYTRIYCTWAHSKVETLHLVR
jgi:hypothetical protein